MSSALVGCASLAATGDADDGGSQTIADSQTTPESDGPGCPDIGLAAATVYFVCDCQDGASAGCVAGDDANAGTKTAPWRTYAKARDAFGNLDAGQTIAFCRGGSFTIDGDRRWNNARCTAAESCVVRDYDPTGSGELAKPILRASSDHGFSLEDGAQADHEEGYTFLNLDVRSTSSGKSGNGFFFYNDIDDVLVCGTDISGFAIGFHAAGSNAPAAGSDGKNARLVLSHARVTDNGDQGFLGGCDGCGVEYSTFDNNGFNEVVLNHNIYFGPRGADGMFARHNDLYRSAIVGGQCEGVSLVVHGRATNLVIEGNKIREDVGKAGAGCWGLTVDTGYAAEPEGFSNVTIRNNVIANVGNLGIGVNACQDCVIENNIVIQEQAHETTLISIPNRPRNADDQTLARVTVRNNTLFARTANRITGVALGGEGSGHVAVSNVVLSTGAGTVSCYDYDLDDTAYQAQGNNVCANTPAQASMFVSAVAPLDFTPAPGSPLIDAGHALSSTTDYNGEQRDPKPDVGAIER